MIPEINKYTYRVMWSEEDGKFMVRVPPEVHRHLAIEAAESGISLNRIASAKLAH